MTPAEAVAMLDRALAQNGVTVILRRVTGSSAQIPFDVEVRAVIAGYQPQDLVGGAIIQGDSKAILSPTEMKRRQWCWPPLVGDKLVVGGKVKNVRAVDQISIQDELVRIEMQIRG